MQLSDYAQALGAAQRLVPSFRDQQTQDLQNRGLDLRNQAVQQDITAQAQAQDYQQQRRGAFQTALGGLGQKPTPDKLYRLGVDFPEFAKTINDAAKGVTEDRRAGVVRQLAPIQALIQNGQTDKALAEVERHIAADKAAGMEPDENDVELRNMLASKDPAQIKAAGGIVYGLLSAVNPDTAAANIGKQTEEQKIFASTGNGDIYNQVTGEVVREGRQKAEYRTIKNADGSESIVQVSGEGGGQASGGGAAGGSTAAPAGRTQFGWTPRARNGGDNTDAAVDGKIAGMASSLGIGADTPFPAGTTPAQIYEALTLSEGGKGTLADTNNNRGNLRDPKTLAYRKFGDKASGDAAGVAQVRRNLARGQNTIRKMVEGVPVGGAAGGGGAKVLFTSGGNPANDPNLTGDAFLASLPAGRRNLLQAIADGRAKPPQPGSKFGQALAEDLARAFPDTDTTQFATRQQTLNAFARGTQGNTLRSLNVAIDHLGVLHDAALALNNGNTPLFNKLSQRFQRETGSPLPTNASAIAQVVGDEVTKAVVGSAGALADREELKKTLDVAGSPAQIMGVTRSYISLMAGQAKGLQTQYEAGTGNRDFGKYLNATTRKQLGIGKPSANASGPSPTPSAPQGGRLVGTYQGRQVFQLPNGKRVVAK